MKVLCYISPTLKAVEGVQGEIRAAAPCAVHRTFRTLEDLLDAVCRPASAPTLVLLFPGHPEELEGIVSIRHLLKGTPVILILPDREERSRTLGYRLTPRFLAYADGDFSEVVAVMERISEQYRKNGLTRERETLWD
jgi:hypothetical protein